MAEYTSGIEAQIAAALGSRGRVGVDDIPGISSDEAADFLRHYALEHAEEGVSFDGSALNSTTPRSAPDGISSAPASALSPVDQVLAAPAGPSALDFTPSGKPVSKWLWALPLSLGVFGGLVAWALIREENSRVARNMLVAGLVITLLTTCLPLACMRTGSPFDALRQFATDTSEWPASQSGLATFYYFGTDT
jgi:hypothetical protein